MMGMKAFKLNDYIERKELTLGNYSQELDAIVRRYLDFMIVQLLMSVKARSLRYLTA